MLKKIPFIILFCMLAFSNKLFAENWQYIETDSQNNFDIYIDFDTIYYDGENGAFLEKLIPSSNHPSIVTVEFERQRTRWVLDDPNYLLRNTKIKQYDSYGNLKIEKDLYEDLHLIPKRSKMYSIVRAAVEYIELGRYPSYYMQGDWQYLMDDIDGDKVYLNTTHSYYNSEKGLLSLKIIKDDSIIISEDRFSGNTQDGFSREYGDAHFYKLNGKKIGRYSRGEHEKILPHTLASFVINKLLSIK